MLASPTQSAKPSLIDSSGFDGAPGPSIRFLSVLWPISVRDTLVQVKQKSALSAIGRFVSIAVRKCTRYQEVGAKKIRKQEREKTSPAGPQQHLANQWAVGSPALGVSFGGPDADRSKLTPPGRCGGQPPCRHSRGIPIAVPFGPRFVSHSRPHLGQAIAPASFREQHPVPDRPERLRTPTCSRQKNSVNKNWSGFTANKIDR